MRHSLLPLVLVLGCLLSACGNSNLFVAKASKVKLVDSTLLDTSFIHRLQPDDKISLSIWDHKDLSVGSVFDIYNSNEVYGKWLMLNSAGQVSLPKIGTVALGGLTADSAAAVLTRAYSKFVIDPIVVVKVLNREVTVLGEVKDPGSYLLEKEKNTLLEVLSRAGGAGFYSKTNSVVLVRDGKKHMLDLNRLDAYTLNNIHLRTNDIIYVPVKGGKFLDKKAPTMLAFASAITTVAVLLSLGQSN